MKYRGRFVIAEGGTLRKIVRLTIHALVAATRTEISMLPAYCGILCSRKNNMLVNVSSASYIICMCHKQFCKIVSLMYN